MRFDWVVFKRSGGEKLYREVSPWDLRQDTSVPHYIACRDHFTFKKADVREFPFP
jgi:hypothetical protein